MDKVNRIRISKFFVFVVISLFILSHFSQVETTTSATQPQDEWVAYPMHISQLANPFALSGYSPSQIRTAYGLPSSGGAGTTIAIIDAYDTPSIWTDLGNFSIQFNLPLPTSNNFEVIKMDPNTGTDSGWAQETCLDVEWAHAIAPDAKILLVEAKNNSGSNLLSAVDYARNRPDVVAISMSWGSNEFPDEAYYDSRFTSSYGAVFFASSGDNGAEVNWPASSANVVAVGGTTLNLTSDGTVISETGWNGSGGGISAFEAIPAYQTSYGLTTTNRTVPDVSYNADLQTGVAGYCNSSWYRFGGTSAGAPQWAAIHALGLSATNTNLYQKAKLAYSSYFRDITSGSNGNYTASLGYDCVTGLGSPLTVNFGPTLEVFPTSGPTGGLITLNGTNFTANRSVNITYLNPITSTWIPIIYNLATSSSQNFTYTFNAPDLQNYPTGDNQSLFDNIVFRAQDNSNSHSYNSTTPYTQWRRGLTQIGNTAAAGLYGNNTNSATSVFVQNGDSILVCGEWFSPGNVSFLWDGVTGLGTILTNETGFFNASVLVPTTTAGQHTLVIRDNCSDFCFNLTRLPTVANDYVDLWHTSDCTINLAPDYSVNETFYRINNGIVCNVTANGQPAITTEGSSNTLEYWSIWNICGTSNMELTHVTLTGIKLDKTAPTGAITINNNYVNTATVTLALSAADSTSGIAQMRFSNDNVEWSSWEQYATSKTWNLQNSDGTKTVTVQYMDNATLISSYSCTTILDTTKPIANAGQNKNVNSGTTVTFDAGSSSDEVGIVSYSWDFGDGSTGTGKTATHTYSSAGTYTAKLTVQDAAGNSETSNVTVKVQENVIPEYSTFIVLFFMITMLTITVLLKKRNLTLR